MGASRSIFTICIVIAGLALFLQPASAAPEHEPATADGQHRVYLGLVAAGSGLANRVSTTSPNPTLSVTARAGLSCSDDETVPVRGARVTVITDDSSRIAMTDEAGNVLFSATTDPTVIQIEWPIGFLPCPNSRPYVELPAGTGEVEFVAVAGP
ncbi:MAG: hypothetical protein ACE5HA_01645 [Anaerolineae bacterium]